MKCPKCNTLNDENSKFCKECGTKLEHNQKDVCPVCSAPISNEKYCPQCGVKIDVSGVDKNETRKQRADRVVNLIFNIFTLIVLGLSTLLVWLPVVTMTNNDVVNNNFGNVFYTLFTQWKDLNFTGLNGIDIAIKLIVTIVPFIVILSNVVVTYIFAIKGIVKTSKNLLDKKPQVYVTPILVILIVNIISVSLLSSFGLNGSLMTTVNTLPGLGSGSIIAFTFILVFGLSVYRIFNSFNKDMVSLFVEKIIFAISCMFGLLLLGNVGISFYGIDATANNSSMAYGTFYVFLERLSMINTPNLGPTYYVGFVQ